MLGLSSEASHPGDLNSLEWVLSLLRTVVRSKRRPPGYPGPRGLNTPPRSFLAPPPSASPADDDKSALRTRMRGVRRELKRDFPDAADGAARAFAAPFAASGRAVPGVAAIYNAQGSELDAWPLSEVLRASGATIVLPVATAVDAPLSFRQVRDGDLFAPDASGMLAPAANAPVLRPALLFLPLLAFDRFGGRLGQGGGYYDRTLPDLRASGEPVIAFGLAYAGQEVDRVPMDGHDARLDGVLTERGLTLFTHHG